MSSDTGGTALQASGVKLDKWRWEHPLHRYIRRALALDALYGSVSELTVQVGQRLASDLYAPGLVHL